MKSPEPTLKHNKQSDAPWIEERRIWDNSNWRRVIEQNPSKAASKAIEVTNNLRKLEIQFSLLLSFTRALAHKYNAIIGLNNDERDFLNRLADEIPEYLKSDRPATDGGRGSDGEAPAPESPVNTGSQASLHGNCEKNANSPGQASLLTDSVFQSPELIEVVNRPWSIPLENQLACAAWPHWMEVAHIMTAKLIAVQAELAELKTNTVEFTESGWGPIVERPDKAGDWWAWNWSLKQWVKIRVTFPQSYSHLTGVWRHAGASPPPPYQ